jgi:hypothetical protein
MYSLNKFKFDKYSQNGEDGILDFLSTKIAFSNPPFVVEFGAWDGILHSNTYRLIQLGYNGLLIESDPLKFKELQANMRNYPGIKTVNKKVTWDLQDQNGDTFDKIGIEAGIPKDFDILSIDIDSNDALIFLSIIEFKPKVVIIEINSTFLPGVEFFHSQTLTGNSFSTTLKIAKSKGYELVAHTGNLIFVRRDLFECIGLNPVLKIYPELIFDSQFINTKREVPETLSRYLFKLAQIYLKIRNLS